MRKTLSAALFLTLLTTAPAFGQADDALKDRVAQLVEKLNNAKDAEAAHASLVKLGPRILTLLPEPAETASKEYKERFAKLKAALAEEQDKTNLDATRITLKGEGIRLSEAIKQLQARSNNPITDLREAAGADVTNPSLDLDIADKPFFEALDVVTRKAGVYPYFFTGDGTIGLMAGGEMMAPQPETKPDAPAYDPLVAYAGPFRVTFKQIVAARNLQSGTGSANAQFDFAWEPRLRPMLLTLKAEEIEIVDDKGNKVPPTVSEESGSVVLRQENPVVEANINMEAPSREAKKLARVKIKAEVSVPAAVRTFRFPNLAAKGTKLTQGDVSITLEETEVEENVWKTRIMLSMPGEGQAFESYRQGLFNNRLWLQRKDGSRFEHNGGFNNTGGDGGTLGFEYLFVDAPGKPSDYQFLYETPGKVAILPLEFEFKDVPLP